MSWHPAAAASPPPCAPQVDERFCQVDSGGAEDSRFRLDNLFLTSAVFRKIHLELAVGPRGLQAWRRPAERLGALCAAAVGRFIPPRR